MKLILKDPVDGRGHLQLIDGAGNDLAPALRIKTVSVLASSGTRLIVKLDIYVDEIEIDSECVELSASIFGVEGGE